MTEAGDLAALRMASEGCRGCELWEPATQVVFSTGAPDAKVMLVGEQPGDMEDREGEPFVGPAGRLLHRAMDEAGIEEQDAYLTNAVKHFRFVQSGKRRIHEKPALAHLVACKPWLDAEVDKVHPELIVVLCATAARSILGPGIKVTKQRGEILTRETPRGETVCSWRPHIPRRFSGPAATAKLAIRRWSTTFGLLRRPSRLEDGVRGTRGDHDFRGKCGTRRPD